MTTYTGIGPSAERLRGGRASRWAGLWERRLAGRLQPPVPQGRQDLPDLLDPSEIQLGEGDPDLVGGLGHHVPPGVGDQAVAEVPPLPAGWPPGPPLRGGNHERLILDGSSPEQGLPVVHTGLVPERAGPEQDR